MRLKTITQKQRNSSEFTASMPGYRCRGQGSSAHSALPSLTCYLADTRNRRRAAMTKPVRITARFHNMALMRQAFEQRRRRLRIG